MYIIQSKPNEKGGYSAIQSWRLKNPPVGYYFFPEKFMNVFYDQNKSVAGFVTIEVDELTLTVTSCTWNEEAYQAYIATIPDPIDSEKEKKLAEISEICQTKINEGADVELTTGTKHFTYTLADQANVSEMFAALAAGATEYPYHADGEACEIYNAQDIITIYSTLSMLKTGQISYQNQLKQYVKNLETIEEVQGIVYGQDLTGEYLESYNTLMESAQTQMQIVLSKFIAQGE